MTNVTKTTAMKTKQPTRAAFRRHLNAIDAASARPISHREGRYRQKSRLYGDYLYHQDRERFEVEYAEWSQAQPA